MEQFDVIVVGAGLSGLVTTSEIVAAGKKSCSWTRSQKPRSEGRPGGHLAVYF